MSPEAAAVVIVQVVKDQVTKTRTQVTARLPRAANALRNEELNVLANPSPSAPGSPPGVRSGDLRRNWTMFYGGDTFGIEAGMGYAGYLEGGTSKMAARPFVQKIQDQAMPQIRSIFQEIGG